MTNAEKSVQQRIETLKAFHAVTLRRVSEAQAQVEAERADMSPPTFLEYSDVIAKPARSYRVDTALAALTVAQRREREAADELALAVALLRRFKENAEAVAGYERAAAAVVNLDVELTSTLASALSAIERTRGRLTALAATANEKLAALPMEVRAAIEPTSIAWLLSESEAIVDRAPRIPALRVVTA